MPIIQQGSVNTNSLLVPDLYVQIVPPQSINVNGVPSDILGIVGTASWGPVNKPVILGGYADYFNSFGPLVPRTNDAGTQVATSYVQGAQSYRVVRVTDGTDTAAANNFNRIGIGVISMSFSGGTGYTNGVQTVTFTGGTGTAATATCVVTGGAPGPVTVTSPGNYTVAPTGATLPGGTGATAAINSGAVTSLLFTGLFTGSLGNSITVYLQAGSTSNSWSLVVSVPGFQPEIFPNATGTGATLWQNLATMVNSGVPNGRGPSNFVIATYQSNPASAAAQSVTLSGGTDGVTSITSAVMVGVDSPSGTVTRTGMYALRGQQCAAIVLSDLSDSTQWTTIDAFAQSESSLAIHVAPSGSAIANGTSGTVDLKNTAGLNSAWSVLLHGDWVYWNDPVSAYVRLVSPQGFYAGRLVNLSPQNSPLNKPLNGVVGTQRSGLPGSAQQNSYSAAELSVIAQNGIEVLTNPGAGGLRIWTARIGHNTSSNTAISGVNYTRMTNYIALSLVTSMGLYIGKPITLALLNSVGSSQRSFLANMLTQGLLATNLDGSLPYAVTCNASNNPQSRTSLGYVQSDTQVTYLAITEKLIINLQGGTSVTVTKSAPAPN